MHYVAAYRQRRERGDMVCLKCLREDLHSSESHYGLHKQCFLRWFKIRGVDEFKDLSRKDVNSGVEKPRFSNINSSFYQGMFRKYSAQLVGVEYILKLGEEDYPELPSTEFLCNQIAEELGINVPPYFLINFFGQRTFVSRVFIDKRKNMTLHHIYHYLREEDEFSVQSLIRIIEEHTGRLSEVEKFVDIILFDALIGNHDRHGRNLAFLEEKGKLTLSPCYDNPSYIGIESDFLLGANHSPRGKISTAITDEPTMKDYAQEFFAMGHEDAVRAFLERVNIDNIKQLVSKGLISEARKTALMRIIHARLEELRHECGLQ